MKAKDFEMQEFENVRSALKSLFEITDAVAIKVDGKPATVKDIQEMVLERAVGIADLLGMSELYLGGDDNATGVDESIIRNH